jgi:hypothetical protein
VQLLGCMYIQACALLTAALLFVLLTSCSLQVACGAPSQAPAAAAGAGGAAAGAPARVESTWLATLTSLGMALLLLGIILVPLLS